MSSSLVRATVTLAVVAVLGCGGNQAPPAGPPPATCANGPVPPTASAAPAPSSSPVAQGIDATADQVLRAINAKDAPGLQAMFNPAMKDALPLDRLGPMLAALSEGKGKLLSSTRVSGDDKSATYRFKAERGDWQMKLALEKGGMIAGLTMTEPTAAPPPVAKSTLSIGLPFKGQWHVFWGGDSAEVNYHVTHESQRRATDLVIVDAGGHTHKPNAKKNEDYFAWGQDVVAVADGTVVTAIDGVAENEPGAMNPYAAMGNAIILEHAGPVYSVYAHLRPGLLKVKTGAKVKKGQLLGLCGNSGNSSEPHLHFQLQDGPLFEKSWGVEPVFKSVTVTRGTTISVMPEYTWLKGDLVGAPLKR